MEERKPLTITFLKLDTVSSLSCDKTCFCLSSLCNYPSDTDRVRNQLIIVMVIGTIVILQIVNVYTGAVTGRRPDLHHSYVVALAHTHTHSYVFMMDWLCVCYSSSWLHCWCWGLAKVCPQCHFILLCWHLRMYSVLSSCYRSFLSNKLLTM